MNLIQDRYLNTLNPGVSVKVTDLHTGKAHKEIAELIKLSLSCKYETFLDNENGVVYVGKRA